MTTPFYIALTPRCELHEYINYNGRAWIDDLPKVQYKTASEAALAQDGYMIIVRVRSFKEQEAVCDVVGASHKKFMGDMALELFE